MLIKLKCLSLKVHYKEIQNKRKSCVNVKELAIALEETQNGKTSCWISSLLNSAFYESKIK